VKKTTLKETVLGIVGRMNFEESLEVKMDCPKCKQKNSVIRRVIKEKQQNIKGRWYVEHCESETCDYWNAGFI
jgi:hypothetical protein